MYEEIEDKDIEKILYESKVQFDLDERKSAKWKTNQMRPRVRLLETGFFEKQHSDEYFFYGLCEIMKKNDRPYIQFEDCKVTKRLEFALKEMIKSYLEGLYGPKDIVVVGISEKRENNGILLDCSEYTQNFMKLNPINKIEYNEVHEIYFLECVDVNQLENANADTKDCVSKEGLEDKVDSMRGLNGCSEQKWQKSENNIHENNKREDRKSENKDELGKGFDVNVLVKYRECTINDFLNSLDSL